MLNVRGKNMSHLEQNRVAEMEKQKTQKEKEDLKKNIKRLEDTKGSVKNDAFSERTENDIVNLKKRQKNLSEEV